MNAQWIKNSILVSFLFLVSQINIVTAESISLKNCLKQSMIRPNNVKNSQFDWSAFHVTLSEDLSHKIQKAQPVKFLIKLGSAAHDAAHATSDRTQNPIIIIVNMYGAAGKEIAKGVWSFVESAYEFIFGNPLKDTALMVKNAAQNLYSFSINTNELRTSFPLLNSATQAKIAALTFNHLYMEGLEFTITIAATEQFIQAAPISKMGKRAINFADNANTTEALIADGDGYMDEIMHLIVDAQKLSGKCQKFLN